MFSRAMMRLGQPVVRRYHGPPDFKPAHMDDLPVPKGCWQDHYSAQNKKYNMHLIAGVVFTGITWAVAQTSGLFYMNATIPEYKRE